MEDEDLEFEGSCEGHEVTGPAFAPMFTGLLHPNGDPIIRHPVAVRIGFHMEDKKYCTPTMDQDFVPSSGAVVGWVYE